MTTPEAPDPTLAAEAADATATVEESPTPPEPMTPERVTAWNRYLDRYIAGGVLLLVFLGAIHPITNASLWPRLKAGQLASSQGPLTRDPFSYTREGQPWVNIPWLFEVVNWQLYDGISSAINGLKATKTFWASTALIVLNALVVTIAAALLLSVRRRGPGLWWSAFCVFLALGGFVVPSLAFGLAPIVGGIASIAGATEIAPTSWGILLLGLEIFLLHRAVNLGRRGALYGLPVIFLLWANIDDSFAFGLIVLAAWLLGALLKPARREEPDAPGLSWLLGLGVLAASAGVVLLNPSLWRIYPTAFGPYLDMVRNLAGLRKTPLTGDQLSFFDPQSRSYFESMLGPGMAWLQAALYLVVVSVGFLSFALNRRRFALGRFLAFVASALLWAGLIRLAPFFSLVFAAVLALNGQEWYHGRFGTEGRLGAGWKLWSDGGRALMILLIFGFLAIGITGFAGVERPFGFGVDDSQFAFEAAEYLRQSDIEGRVLNLSVSHGDALIWADPRHKTYIDSRQGLFPDALREELRDLRNALREDKRSEWAPILEKYGATTLMLSPRLAVDVPVYEALLRNPSFVPYYDDGNAVLFGRVDQKTADRDRFLKNRLDAEQIVYQRFQPLDEPERTPAPVDWVDQILRHRALEEPGPHVAASARWLGQVWSVDSTEQPPEPADCLMAIREARIALARNPDDKFAFQLLNAAYQSLIQAEMTILGQADAPSDSEAVEAAITFRASTAQDPRSLNFLAPATPPANVPDAFRSLENAFITRILQPPPEAPPAPVVATPDQFIFFRYRQRVAALNFAIQLTPPPRTTDAKQGLALLHGQLADLYLGNQTLDLARDHLQAARDLVGPTAFGELRQQQLDQLIESVERFQAQLDEYAANQQAGPIQRANLAMQNGFLGLAIEELRAAESAGVSLLQVRPMLIDLYGRVGLPNEAFTLLEQTTVNDPSLATGPGTAAHRQGLVYLFLGYYSNASFYWQSYAIPELRRTEAFQALNAARGLLVGDPANTTRSVLEISGTPGSQGYLETQAHWEFEIGLVLLESGIPQDVYDPKGTLLQQGAVSHFRKALELDPELPTRPLIAYYLEKLGAEVPAKDAKGDANKNTDGPGEGGPSASSDEPPADTAAEGSPK